MAGEFFPYQEVELHAKVAGYIRRTTADIGDRVRAGEVLATPDVPELTTQAAARVRVWRRHGIRLRGRRATQLAETQAQIAYANAGMRIKERWRQDDFRRGSRCDKNLQ